MHKAIYWTSSNETNALLTKRHSKKAIKWKAYMNKQLNIYSKYW